MALKEELKKADKIPNLSKRQAEYKKIIEGVFKNKQIGMAKDILAHILEESSRLESFLPFAQCFEYLDGETLIDFGNWTLDQVSDKNVFKEDQIIRENLAEESASNGDYEQAASILEKVRFSPGASDEDQASVFIQISEYWFEEEDATFAEKYLDKATHCMDIYNFNEGLVLSYKYCKAKLLDAKRKFALASMAYYDLSVQPDNLVAEDDKMKVLKESITCAVLSPRGD